MGVIFNLQHFCTDDGDGIRSTVFLKGCLLRCAWCHNPESQEAQTEIFYDETRCIRCGACVAVCAHGAQTLRNGKREFLRENCLHCGKCASVCHAKALESCGKERTAKSIVEEVSRYLPFFEKSGGGLTVSGGEPLFQADFTLEICRLAQKAGIQVCVETSGFGKTEALLALVPFVEHFLFDFKITGERAKKYIGADDTLILKNLFALDNAGGKTVLRCPIIPAVNDGEDHFRAIVRTVKKLTGITEIQLLPYHPLGVQKAKKIGKISPYGNPDFLDSALLKETARNLQLQTNIKTTVH